MADAIHRRRSMFRITIGASLDVLVATTTQVSDFFDNFNNIDEPNNFVIANLRGGGLGQRSIRFHAHSHPALGKLLTTHGVRRRPEKPGDSGDSA
jgi:hypothetical protein